jgi:hypothetical protein
LGRISIWSGVSIVPRRRSPEIEKIIERVGEDTQWI